MTDTLITTRAIRRRLADTYATHIRAHDRFTGMINPEAPRRRATHDELQVYLQNQYGAVYNLGCARYEFRVPVHVPRNQGYHHEYDTIVPPQETFREVRVTIAEETLTRCHSIEELEAIVRDNTHRAVREEPPLADLVGPNGAVVQATTNYTVAPRIGRVTHDECAGGCGSIRPRESEYCLKCNNS